MTFAFLIVFELMLTLLLFRRNGGVAALVSLSIIVLNILILLNVYVITLKGSANDAHYFYTEALSWAEYGELMLAVNTQFFVQFLGSIAYVLSSDKWEVLSSFSVLIYIASAYIFYRLIYQFGSTKYILIIMAVFIFSPNYFIRASFTMREVYEVFVIIGMVYSFMLYYEKKHMRYLLALLLLSLFGVFLHKVFVAFVPALLFSMMFYYFLSKKKYSLLVLSLAVIGLIIPVLAIVKIPGFDFAYALFNYDVEYLDHIAASKFNKDYSSSYYGTKICLTGVNCFLLSYVKSYYYYTFYILPWDVHSTFDVYALIGSMVKLLLMINMFLTFRKVKHGYFMVYVFFLITSIWAFGTVNYGTAMRHGVTTNWILLFFASYYMNDFVSKASKFQIKKIYLR